MLHLLMASLCSTYKTDWPLTAQVGFELGEHAQHVEERLASAAIGAAARRGESAYQAIQQTLRGQVVP